jgi:hypothetical protein
VLPGVVALPGLNPCAAAVQKTCAVVGNVDTIEADIFIFMVPVIALTVAEVEGAVVAGVKAPVCGFIRPKMPGLACS